MRTSSGYLAAALCLAALALSAEVVDRVVAVVGNEVITERELEKAYYSDSMGLMKPNPISGAPALELTREEYLEFLIEQKIIQQEIKRQGITVDDMEVERAVARKRESAGLDEDEFNQALRQAGITPEEYRQLVREQLINYRLISQEVRGEIEVTEEEIMAYYKQRPEQFYSKDKYHLRLIFLRFTTYATPEEKQQTIDKLVEIRAAVTGAEDFAAKAVEHSQATSAASGGDIGWFVLDEMLDIFRENVEGLKAGEMSQVFFDESGAYLLFCEEIKPGEPLELEQVKEKIFEILYQQEAMERYNLWLERLKAKTYVDNRLQPEEPKPEK